MKTIKDIEKEIEFYELVLSCKNIAMPTWSDTISKYHAAKIRLCQMRGESPTVLDYKPEHIV